MVNRFIRWFVTSVFILSAWSEASVAADSVGPVPSAAPVAAVESVTSVVQAPSAAPIAPVAPVESVTSVTSVTSVAPVPQPVPPAIARQLAVSRALPPPSYVAAPGSSQAFDQLLQQNMPMSPAQILRLRQQIDSAQRAASIPALPPPKPVSSTIMINLAPGTFPPAIRIAQGYITSLVFVDSTGAPWPISAFNIGNPKAVNIQWDGKSNLIMIQSVQAYGQGDLVIQLQGLPTPISLSLVAGQPVVDYRIDLHVPGVGPNATEQPDTSALPQPATQLLLGVLDGVAPQGSQLLVVRGADAMAWVLNDKMYLRTRLTLLSPGFVGKMVSPDGMNAYELPKSSTILVSRYGEPVELQIEGF